ncbi:MAG: DEAD/DEAH box helicase family protein [Planctomycetota bacterium]
MTRLPLKEYQKETLHILTEYCREVRRREVLGEARAEHEAFRTVTGRDQYYTAPGFEGVPYICLRLPTGGGKTLLAAESIGEIGRALLGTDQPACLWITPSTTIRDQTLRALRRPTHPYRLALEESLACSVEVVTLEEALTKSGIVRSKETALVIVTTIQSYRLRDEPGGEELASTRRIYRDNGYLQEAFQNLPVHLRADLACDENGLVNLSLANALRLRRPIVIMDEAHNARTPTSFESLARFGPKFVLELTATPEQRHDPRHPTDPRFASNVLHAVSALELKNEGMIKLPVDLESRGDWLEVLAATVQRRDELETIADREYEEQGLPFSRPIALIQAQPSSKTRETHTVEKVKAALLEQLEVPADHVRICTGTIDEIGEEDLLAGDCPVRYIVTVDKLREGWDCPLAYVLGSIGNAATPTAVEQLIGRILRMPNATPSRVPALDRAYAFVLSDDVVRTAMQLRDRMVQNCGFDDRSADEALRVTSATGEGWLGLGRIPLNSPPVPQSLSPGLTQKTRYDESTHTLVVSDLLDRHEVQTLCEALTEPADRAAVEAYWERERPVGIAVKPLGQYAKPLLVPRLTLKQGDRRTLFEPEELDNFAWDMARCEPGLSEGEFASDIRVGTAVTIDMEANPGGRDGRTVMQVTGDVRLKQLELIGEGDDWSAVELTRWLDRELHRGDSFLGLPLKESQPWLHRAVEHLLRDRGLSLPIVVRRRHMLAERLRMKVAEHGRSQIRRAAEWLIRNEPDAIETSAEFAIRIEEENYRPSRCFQGGLKFRKHAFDLVFEMNGEEAECAARIDSHANVLRWIRNTEHESQGGFWLPKSPGKYFPDFLVELQNGIIVLVEYKMGKMASDPEEQHKRAVGQLWEARSGGRGRYAWILDRNWQGLVADFRE